MSCIKQSAFDVVDKIRLCSSHSEVFDQLRLCEGLFGYDAFLVSGIPRSSCQNLSDCKIIARWPAEWERRYEARRYIHIDPVISHIRGSSDPFSWQEAVDAEGEIDGHIVMEEARAFGLNYGLCVPLHRFDGLEAGVSFGGERFEPSQDERAALHLIAIYAMSTAKRIAEKHSDHGKDTKTKALLSTREVECLKWAADGKTAWEISVILSISQRTVEQYLNRSALKLEAVGRTHCVAEALRRGIIH